MHLMQDSPLFVLKSLIGTEAWNGPDACWVFCWCTWGNDHKGIRKLYWIIKQFKYTVTTHLVHVNSMQAHLGRRKLWRQSRIRLAEHPGVTCRHANEKETLITSDLNRTLSITSFPNSYLSPIVWSLQYMVPSWCCRDGRRVCERERLAWGCWDVERDARTLAAAEAALLGGMKRRFLPGSPEAVSTGWANTLANRLSGWNAEIMQKHMHLIKGSEKWAGNAMRQM